MLLRLIHDRSQQFSEKEARSLSSKDRRKYIYEEETARLVWKGRTSPSEAPGNQARSKISCRIQTCLGQRGKQTNDGRHGQPYKDRCQMILRPAEVASLRQRKYHQHEQKGTKSLSRHGQGHRHNGGSPWLVVEFPKHLCSCNRVRCAANDLVGFLKTNDGWFKQHHDGKAGQQRTNELCNQVKLVSIASVTAGFRWAQDKDLVT